MRDEFEQKTFKYSRANPWINSNNGYTGLIYFFFLWNKTFRTINDFLIET